tara:strand:+ start:5902 stop:6477 length:576 start_codon:yes stop_codon:yes gene_type:complete
MLFELRTYDLKPGKAPAYLEFFRTFGVRLVTRHLPMGGYWMVESGRLNRIEHLWIYEDFADRDACRASLGGERAWIEDFIPKAFADVVVQENRLMSLEATSDRFDAVIAARKAVHDNQKEGSPMFADKLMGLAIYTSMPMDRGLATFRVLTGNAPGSFVSFSTGAFDDLMPDSVGLVQHELLRPLTVSPLQ